MKKLIPITLSLLLYNCFPKIKSSITSKQKTLNPDALVLVLQPTDEFKNDGVELGTIKAGDNGFSTNCSYDEVIIQLKHQARQDGANVIKIIEHKTPDLWSTCSRIKAKLFRVPNIRKHEKVIEWVPYRKLTWKDFKGTPKLASNNRVAAQTYCGFQLSSNRVTTFKKAKLFVKNIFDCHLSWVRPDQLNRDDLLLHEQKHFDLSEVYTRRLRKELDGRKLNAYNLNNEVQSVFKKIYEDYVNRQEDYDRETKHGLDSLKQTDWNVIISKELRLLNHYAN